MSNRKPSENRRQFLKAGAAAAVALTARAHGEDPAPKAAAEAPVMELPRRKLGKTGEMIPVLSLGTGAGPSTRLYEYAYKKGVKYFDVADCYGRGKSEENAAKWFETSGKRKEIFLVTKDHPREPEHFVKMADNRLKTLKTDIIDLFFIHGIGDDEYPEACVDWPTDKAWSEVADKLKKTRKIKYFGFSTHCQPIEKRIALLNNAAKGGFVDAIMVATDPQLMHTNKDFNKALDACHKAGIGLIAMKTTRGVAARRRRGGGEGEGQGGFPETIPGFEKTGWDKFGTVINAILTDERFSAICSAMDNIKLIDANSASARAHKPLTPDQHKSLMLAYEKYAMGYCNGCNGNCQMAAGGGVEFGTIARYLAYAEQDGRIGEARRLYQALPAAARDFSKVDLHAASKACVSRLDLAAICERADALLA